MSNNQLLTGNILAIYKSNTFPPECRMFESVKSLLGELSDDAKHLVIDWLNKDYQPECLLRDIHDNPSVLLRRLDMDDQGIKI